MVQFKNQDIHKTVSRGEKKNKFRQLKKNITIFWNKMIDNIIAIPKKDIMILLIKFIIFPIIFI